MGIVLLAVLVIVYTLQSLLCRQYSDRYPGDPDDASPVFTIVSGLTVTVVSVILCGFRFDVSLWTVVLGIANALALTAYNRFLIQASQTGPYSILMIFSLSGGIVIPAVVDMIFFHNQLSLVEIACIAVVLGSVYLVSSKDEKNVFKKGFWFASVGLCIANGVYGALLASQQKITGVGEKEEMVAITYCLAAILCLVTLGAKKKKSFFGAMRQSKISLAYLIVCSLIVATGIHLLTFLINKIDLTLLYTFDNSSVLLLSVLCSWAFFKEKLSWKNILGCFTMCGALIVMSLFG